MSKVLFVVKDNSGCYYCGFNVWNKQLRKAKIYSSYKYAVDIRDDIRFIERGTKIVNVEIKEIRELGKEDKVNTNNFRNDYYYKCKKCYKPYETDEAKNINYVCEKCGSKLEKEEYPF